MRIFTFLCVLFFTLTTSGATSDSASGSDTPASLESSEVSESSHTSNPANLPSSPSKSTAAHKPLTTIDDTKPAPLSPHEFGDKPNGSYFPIVANFTGTIPPPSIMNNSISLWQWMSNNLATTIGGAYFRFINSPHYMDGIPDRFPQWVAGWERRIDSMEEWESYCKEAPGGFREPWQLEGER